MNDTNQAQDPKAQGAQFNIQRIYVKDISFESPKAPNIFRDEWKPQVNVDLQTNAKPIEDNMHEVVLHLTVTVKSNDATAFIIEVKQAGIFTIKGVPQDQLNHALGSLCPGILYPYAREAISDVVTKGGFPQLLLAPVNFDALYMQHLEQQKKQAQAADTQAAN